MYFHDTELFAYSEREITGDGFCSNGVKLFSQMKPELDCITMTIGEESGKARSSTKPKFYPKICSLSRKDSDVLERNYAKSPITINSYIAKYDK